MTRRLLLVAALLAACTANPGPATTVAPTDTDPPPATTAPGDHAIVVEPSKMTLGDELIPGVGNRGYDVDHYLLDLAYDGTVLSGTATIEATATETLTAFSFDFSTLRASSVAVDGAPARFQAGGGKLRVAPATPLPAGEGFAVTVEYGGVPRPVPSVAFDDPIGWFGGDRGAHVLAEPDASHSWFPANDHPSDRAAFTYRLTVPDGLFAAAAGSLRGTQAGTGTTTYVWESPGAVAPYLATVLVGDYQIVTDEASTLRSGVTVRNVLAAGQAAAPPAGLDRQGEMLALFAGRFGAYPYREYGVAIVAGGEFGALETVTLSLVGDVFVESDATVGSISIFELVLAHELAHHWFGNHVGIGRWRDVWLSEGFASYAEWLWLEHLQGRDFVEAAIAAERERLVGDGVAAPAAPTAETMFGPAVYRAGAVALHALRLTVGDETFFAILQTYVQRFGGATATSDDFVALAEEVSGVELESLMEAWLYGDTLPELPAP